MTGAQLIETYLGDGVWKVEEGKASLFYGRCDMGCFWMLSPDYRSMRFVAQHGASPEHALAFDRVQPFDPASLLMELDAWLGRCHAYEAALDWLEQQAADHESSRVQQLELLEGVG